MQFCTQPSTVEGARFRTGWRSRGTGPPNDLDNTHTNSWSGSPRGAAWQPVNRAVKAGLAGISLSAWLLGSVITARALEPTTPLATFARQSWVMENGLPQNTVQALLQTRDGFVWLGTEVGLVRFDGNNFVLFDRNSNPALPGSDVRCLLESRDGALWIGTSEGLARWKDGAVTAYSTANGLPGNVIRALSEDKSGSIWAYTDAGLARKVEDRFETVGDWRPGSVITATTSNGQSSHWVDLDARPPETRGGRQQHRRVSQETVLNLSIFRAVTGLPFATKNILVTETSGRIAARFTAGRELPGSRIQALLADREGCLWIGTNSGLARLAGGKLQSLPVTDPLASASVLTIMEDREGNLWVGTETGGLHILRDERFRTFGAREGLSSDATTTVVEDHAGTLWVGTAGSGLNSVARSVGGLDKIRTYTVRDGLLSDVILSLAAAPNGDLWVGTPDGLSRIRKGAVASFTSADGLPDDFIRSLLVDADGSLWIGTRRGLTHWTGDTATHLETLTQANGLGSDLVGAMERDANGNLWVATLAGLSRLQGARAANLNITNYTSANGLSSNVITALLPRGGGSMMIGTQDHGWSYWDGQRFSPTARNGLDQTTIHAILDDGLNHLWFATGNGIARCDCDMAGGCSHWVEFGPADGLRSRETATNSHPSALRSHDGLLWFATPKGLAAS